MSALMVLMSPAVAAMVLVDHRVPLTAGDEPAVDRESHYERHGEREREAPPEQQTRETRLHSAGDGGLRTAEDAGSKAASPTQKICRFAGTMYMFLDSGERLTLRLRIPPLISSRSTPIMCLGRAHGNPA